MFKKKEKNIFKIVTIILSVILILIINYVIIDVISDNYKEKLEKSYDKGYEQSRNDFILTIYKETNDCTTTNLIIGEETRTLIDLNCMK